MFGSRRHNVGWVSFLGLALPSLALANTHPVILNSQIPGLTPFIEVLRVHVADAVKFASVQFTIAPKAGSFTRPISATYSAAYMISRGFWNGTSPDMRVPVFGLYAGATNTVTLSFNFSDATSTVNTDTITTAAFSDSCNVFNNLNIVKQGRQATGDISFDYFLLKKYCSKFEPSIVDTDGQVRWVGDAHTEGMSSILFNNRIYVSEGVKLEQEYFDGPSSVLVNYKSIGVTSTMHHNFDAGRTGFIMDVDTTAQTEAVAMEVDTSGKVLNTWDFSKIISKAMTNGGDNPSGFVFSRPNDWFHLNATTYDPVHNLLIASSRENFVIAVDYDTQKIQWILGDTTKHWYQYPSLKAFALTVPGTGLAPIGQHAVSIDDTGNLLLMDDGLNSALQMPPGLLRKYSSPRAYRIDTAARTATEVFTYDRNQTIYSPICSSAYEDTTPGSYLLDYSVSQGFKVLELFGINTNSNQVIFDFQYPAVNYCAAGWNAEIVHLENLKF